MKCMNCNAEISPQYVHAIANNTCPGCGGSIYDDQTKDLYNELKDAMLRMPNDPVGLAGWLLDNYKLSKIGTAEPVEKFYSKNQKENKAKQSPEKTNEFFQRARVSPQTKSKLIRESKDYDSLVEQINSNVNGMYGESEDEVDMGGEYQAADDIEAAQELGVKFNNEELILPGKPLVKSEMKELHNLLNKPVASTSESILESERLTRLQRQENMLSGGGGFKR